jgi:hypothetical protein
MLLVVVLLWNGREFAAAAAFVLAPLGRPLVGPMAPLLFPRHTVDPLRVPLLLSLALMLPRRLRLLRFFVGVDPDDRVGDVVDVDHLVAPVVLRRLLALLPGQPLHGLLLVVRRGLFPAPGRRHLLRILGIPRLVDRFVVGGRGLVERDQRVVGLLLLLLLDHRLLRLVVDNNAVALAITAADIVDHTPARAAGVAARVLALGRAVPGVGLLLGLRRVLHLLRRRDLVRHHATPDRGRPVVVVLLLLPRRRRVVPVRLPVALLLMQLVWVRLVREGLVRLVKKFARGAKVVR